MPSSRSPSPSPNSPLTNSTPSPGSTTSRNYILKQNPYNFPIDQSPPELRQPVASTSTAPPVYAYSQVVESGIKRPLSAVTEGENPSMVKRYRMLSPAPKVEDLQERMSPSSDSPDPENEQNDSKGKFPGQHPQEDMPTKKKRTRTLTTPHQAAVLHALLAQSRFPTTAMREEVGRSIGLSARKVQIWFQNQRQKARRPRKEPDDSAPLPPRYGPFPAYPPQGHSSPFPVMPGPYGRPQFPRESSRSQSVEPPSQLLGPGVPGADGTRTDTPYASGSPPQVHSPPPAPITRHAASSYDQNFNRTLPPLSYHSARPLSEGAIVSGVPRPQSPLVTLSPPEYFRPRTESFPSSPRSHFISRSHDVHGQSRIILPPPFTLQPQPRWNEMSFAANLRPAAFVRPPSEQQATRASSASPLARRALPPISPYYNHLDPEQASLVPDSVHNEPLLDTASTSSNRGSRYDPVRASFIPYSATINSTPTSSPLAKSLSEADDDPVDG
ncbi:transcriptional regulator family: Homeodomain [Agaricus bisporus var. burnettii]|uniref:Transcriptional regulator family: Homeodomain n=1 Tax=Agaricus bisporus var. burnettii TaxID=192524 RepID=A0A8H7C2E1_AGABI|nr:transcriptional regulator family: Homeodomain [Agaricus bisporus var. burnettii]